MINGEQTRVPFRWSQKEGIKDHYHHDYGLNWPLY